jgi:glycosyltransferase 2 family protein
MSVLGRDISGFLKSLRVWRARLTPLLGTVIVGVFLYLIWIYRQMILSTFEKVGLIQMTILLIMMCCGVVLSALAFAIPAKDMGYHFGVVDGYHSLNLSQLASAIPGGVWGYAGLATVLWSKGISKPDSAVIIVFYTVIMLTACAMMGIGVLITAFGAGYAAICLLPFLFLVFGRNWLDRVRQKYLPRASPLPSVYAAIKMLLLGLIVWMISSSGFVWLLYASAGFGVIPFWKIVGAYAAAYLAGYISLFAPSGLGVSEGLVSLLLGPYVGASKVLAAAISFRIIQTLIVWGNILITIALASRRRGAGTTDGPAPM